LHSQQNTNLPPNPRNKPQSTFRFLTPLLFFSFSMIQTSLSADKIFSVPRLQGPASQPPTEHLETFSAPWRMQQAWRDEEQQGFRPGTVSMAWQPDALLVFAALPDEQIFSASTADGQNLWTLGDVFEIFVRRETSPVYLELHASPNGHQLHLRWTEEGMQRIIDKQAHLQEFVADARAFQSVVTRLANAEGWAVYATIPAAILPDGAPFSPGEKISISFCRYDTDSEGKNAILSSTSPHEKPSYHRLKEWRSIVLD
jgi:hypothetical protein